MSRSCISGVLNLVASLVCFPSLSPTQPHIKCCSSIPFHQSMACAHTATQPSCGSPQCSKPVLLTYNSLAASTLRGVISSGPSAFLAGQGRFGLNGNGLAECPRCRGNFVEVLTEHERRRIQIARQARVCCPVSSHLATSVIPRHHASEAVLGAKGVCVLPSVAEPGGRRGLLWWSFKV